MATKEYQERLQAQENLVKDICGNPSAFTVEQCRMADIWIKHHALAKFDKHCASLPAWATRVLRPWANAHFGSVEVDILMTELKCYPEWVPSGWEKKS